MGVVSARKCAAWLDRNTEARDVKLPDREGTGFWQAAWPEIQRGEALSLGAGSVLGEPAGCRIGNAWCRR